MKKVSNYAIVIMCFILVFFGFIYGYFSNISKRIEKPEEDRIGIENSKDYVEKNVNMNIEEDIESNVEDSEYVGPNTLVEYITNYKECNHYKTKAEKAKEDMINMKEKQFRIYITNNHPNWNVIEFSHERIVIGIDKDSICPDHYIIGIKDGKIAIFKVNEDGQQEIYQIIDVPVSVLKEIDQRKLEKGIRVDSETEIGNILEDFIS